ncbi:glycoside hydrolase family 3 N-terminal domain-containing protein [Mycobacterium aquaticum]|nr:glycoside hydrolase family 3 N-terminal domain-containing protein [Mycobacterium aquaticum]
MNDVSRAAHTVLFPISHTFDTDGWFGDFLTRGGRSVLMASSAEEYAARRISDERRARETAEHIRDFGARANARAGRPVVLAVDAEPAGVQRLEHLLPRIPGRADFPSRTDEQLHAAFGAYGAAARELGVSMFVGPVLDVITGSNAWLTDRTMATELAEAGRIGAAYTTAVQAHGVTAMAKHFPGHPDLPANAIYADVVLDLAADEVDRNIEPFRRLIAEGVGSVMVGPTVVTGIDPVEPAATSKVLIDLLRAQGFSGIVVSDDLDAASTMRGRSLGEVAVASVAAGVQMLLIPGARQHVSECVDALVHAVGAGELALEVLQSAAAAVDSLADRSVTLAAQPTRT